MGNSNGSGVCDESAEITAVCSDSSVDKHPMCEYVGRLVFLLKSDCYITRVFYPLTGLLIAIGTILNLFSLYCFLKTNKRSSQNVYLSVLSLGDTLNLHINFTLPLLRKIDRFDDYFRNATILCRITGVFTEFFLIFPTWIIVLLTSERLICISWRLKRRSSYAQTRAKISIMILAIIVLFLSLYRLLDLNGIDQGSVFTALTCNGTGKSITWLRNFNLIIWAILPECLTLILSLIIMYQIKLAAQRFQPGHFEAHPSKYNQATKTVLRISVLFLIFHTPTGILIALNLFYGNNQESWGVVVILVSRKLTMILYEISLCCKFFIYTQTFQSFKIIMRKSINHFIRRNSAKLGRPVLKNPPDYPKQRTFQFNPRKRSITSPGSQSDSFTKSTEEHHHILNNRHQQTSSTSISRLNREHQPMIVAMTRRSEGAHVSLPETPDLLHCTRGNRRSLWSAKTQVTL